jgi:hypothetical protein
MTELTGIDARQPTPMEERLANCEAILAALVILDSLANSDTKADRTLLLIAAANLALTIGEC